MLAFMGQALSRDQSVTVSEFIARRHGDDCAVRLLAASLSMTALLGVLILEMLAVATLLRPVLSSGDVLVIVFGLVLMMALGTMRAGNSGVMHAGQVLLGALYLSLFASTALLLYLQVSELPHVPPYGTVAILFVAAFCIVMPFYRRIRYIDTGPVRDTSSALGTLNRLLVIFKKSINVGIAIFSVLATVLAGMELSAQGGDAILRDSVAALQAGTGGSVTLLVALILQPLFSQIVDVTNWQRIAGFEMGRIPNDPNPDQWPRAFERLFATYAVESPLLWLFMCAFGAVASVATGSLVSTGDTRAAHAASDFIEQLGLQQNLVAVLALWLLLVGLFAMALSAMSAAFSASLCVIRYDLLRAIWPEPAPAAQAAGAQASGEANARRGTVVAGGALCLALAAAFYIVDGYLQITLASSTFLAVLFALSCAPLSFVPLVLGPLIAEGRGGRGSVSPGWALVIIGVSAATGIGAVVVSLATGYEPWLWAAVPACLGSGAVLFIMARYA
jgi:hypothetical protein